MKKLNLKDALFLIFAIVFTIRVTIKNISLIPVACELSIDHFGLNIESFITVVTVCILILLTVICVISAIKVIQCIFFYK